MNDIIKEREWKVRYERDWSDAESEEFVRDYMNLLPSSPLLLPFRRGPQFRARRLAMNPLLSKDLSLSQICQI